MTDTEQIYKAWQAVGADLAGLKWDDFVAALAQPEQEQWDAIPDAFNEWWNADYDDTGNPYRKDSPAYWAWSGWKAASKQPEQEPSGWRLVPVEPTQEMLRATEVGPVNLPLFCWKAMLSAAPNPPQRIWVGLTESELFKLWVSVPAETEDRFAFARVVEAKLKEKNT